MTALPHAVTEMIVAAEAPEGAFDPQQFRELSQAIFEESDGAEDAEVSDALRRLSEVIATANPFRASLVALTCGALVENGADPTIAIESILDRLPEVLERADAFARACVAEWDAYAADETIDQEGAEELEDDGEDEEDQDDDFDTILQAVGPRVAEADPEGARAWFSHPNFCLAAVAMLAASPSNRRIARQRRELKTLAEPLAEVSPPAGFLAKLLSVLDDEELIVLDPEQKRGYRVRIQGIADNFQLHTLLADALIGNPGEGWLPGTRPDPRVVAAAKDQPVDPDADTAEGAFNLVQWTGLRADGTMDSANADSEHWIWNEGVPADILPFEGVRVVLLQPPPYSRFWNADRAFGGMTGHVAVEEILSPEAVRDWLDRIAAAPRPPGS